MSFRATTDRALAELRPALEAELRRRGVDPCQWDHQIDEAFRHARENGPRGWVYWAGGGGPTVEGVCDKRADAVKQMERGYDSLRCVFPLADPPPAGVRPESYEEHLARLRKSAMGSLVVGIDFLQRRG